jgi:uncharacterized membrane protein
MFGQKLKTPEKKRSLKNIFITGIVALMPLVVTFYIIRIFYNLIVSNLHPVFLRIAAAYKVSVPESLTGIVTVALFVLLVLLVGVLTRMYVGKLMLTLIDRTAASIPVVSSIYNAIKQIIESFHSSTDNFQKVVLVEFPKSGVYCMGFVVKKTPPVVADVVGVPCLNIYLPTAPNPTSGFITVMPEASCMDLDITVEQGIKFIFSVGIINFDSPKEAKAAVNGQGLKKDDEGGGD